MAYECYKDKIQVKKNGELLIVEPTPEEKEAKEKVIKGSINCVARTARL